MQWLRAVNSLRQDRQAATAAAKRRVIGDGDVDLERAGDRSQQTLGLSQRLLEYQAEREARLDGDCRVDRLTTPLSGGRRLPCRDRLLGTSGTNNTTYGIFVHQRGSSSAALLTHAGNRTY